VVRFRAGQLEFTASVVESSQLPSPQTGDPLQSMTIQFRAQKAGMHEAAVTQALERQSGGLFSLAASNEPELEWRVCESNWTYVGSEPWGVNHHVWRIEQVERLACERLVVDGIALEPYDYVEEVGEPGVVRLAARAHISEADLERMSRIVRPIEVVRSGISETPRSMRLLGYVWGERPEGPAVAITCEDVHEPRVTVRGFDGQPDDDLADLVELLGRDVTQLSALRHARRKVSNIDGWSL
jgi:hypothetical protein